jgi:predicted ATPase
MRIKELTIKGYRSLLDVSWPGLGEKVVIFGSNAVGKSNLLRILNLLLVRIPHAAKRGLVTDLRIKHEPAAIHPLHSGKTIDARIVIEQEVEAARVLLTRADEMSVAPGERTTLQRMLGHLGTKKRATVEMDIALRPSGDWQDAAKNDVYATVRWLTVDGQVWFGKRDDNPPVAIEKITKGKRKSNEPIDEPNSQVSAELLPYSHKLLIALTQGFVYVDCPRVLEPNESRAFAAAMRRSQQSTAKVNEDDDDVWLDPPNWWLDIEDRFLTSRLHGASQDPQFALRFDRLRKHLLDEGHGWLGIRSFFRNEEEILELFLRDLNGLPRDTSNSFYIPAASQGTGFIQKLHILAACYLSGASVVGIEELEVNLAPSTQRELWTWLQEQTDHSRGTLEQVFVTSHSPIFLESGSHDDDIDVWYASHHGQDGTKLERLKRDGETDPVREKLRKHFGPIEGAYWKIGAEAWQHPDDNQHRFEAMYDGEEKFGTAFDLPTLERLLDKTKSTLKKELVFLKAWRLSLQQSPSHSTNLFGALAVGRWWRDGEGDPPRMLRVEWTDMGTGNAERKIRVEGSPAAQGEEQTLVLVVEERVSRGNLDPASAAEFFAKMTATMDEILARLQSGLTGG